MFYSDVLRPVYDENLLVWLKNDIVGTEVHMDYMGVSVSFSYVD